MVDPAQLVELMRAQNARDAIVKADDSRMAVAMLAAVLAHSIYVPYESDKPPPDYLQQRAVAAVNMAEIILAEVQRRRVPTP